MRKKGFFIFLSALLLSAQTCGDRNVMKYNESLGKWKAEGIVSYYVKVDYRAFSPQQGVWELRVENGKIAAAWYNGAYDSTYIKQAERFTVDSIYRAAEGAAGCNDNSPMCVTVEFSDTAPYIRSVKRVNNSSFSGKVMKDAGYSIVIVEFKRG